jgi:hypothetical protein
VWSASRPGRFTPRERTTNTRRIGGWLNPRTGLDDLEKREILPLPGFELRRRPARSQSIFRLLNMFVQNLMSHFSRIYNPVG